MLHRCRKGAEVAINGETLDRVGLAGMVGLVDGAELADCR